jgi:hypothetical protein
MAQVPAMVSSIEPTRSATDVVCCDLSSVIWPPGSQPRPVASDAGKRRKLAEAFDDLFHATPDKKQPKMSAHGRASSMIYGGGRTVLHTLNFRPPIPDKILRA